jgi:hypothetical protein
MGKNRLATAWCVLCVVVVLLGASMAVISMHRPVRAMGVLLVAEFSYGLRIWLSERKALTPDPQEP